MDRICQGSGRGLTDFSEDKRDRGENIRDLGKYSENATEFTTAYVNPHKAERRIVPGIAFTESATWVRSTVGTPEQNAMNFATNHIVRIREEYDSAEMYLTHPVNRAPPPTYTEYVAELEAMQLDGEYDNLH